MNAHRGQTVETASHGDNELIREPAPSFHEYRERANYGQVYRSKSEDGDKYVHFLPYIRFEDETALLTAISSRLDEVPGLKHELWKVGNFDFPPKAELDIVARSECSAS